MNVMAYTSYMLKSIETNQPPYEDVINDIKRLLSESEVNAARELFSRDDYNQARFAICAWVDEAILISNWLHTKRWLMNQLQRIYYKTNNAGIEFFDRLNGIGLHQRDVREVYYLCLALGFTGRYCSPGDGYNLEQIKTSTLKLLMSCTNSLPSMKQTDFSPETYQNVSTVSSKKTSIQDSKIITLVCLAAPLLLFCILFLIYLLTLSEIRVNLLRGVKTDISYMQ
jgi:type VI secretion system protein ImpK